MDVDVRDDTARHRFEARVDGRLAAIAEHIRNGDLVVFTHTEVLDGFAGRGVAGTLVHRALDEVRPSGRAVLPVCPFVSGWIARHEDEYGDLRYRSRTRVQHVD